MKAFKTKEISLQKKIDTAVNSFLKYAVYLGISIVIGMLMLLAVYALPVARMKANVARSSEIFNYEGIYPQIVQGYQYMRLDNYTDSIMLGAAIYDGEESVADKAVNNYHIDSTQITPELAMTNYANEVDAYDYFAVSYGRYWHGYLVPLKLLLLFFDYADIRILNFFMQSLLLFMIMRQLYRIRRGGVRAGISHHGIYSESFDGSFVFAVFFRLLHCTAFNPRISLAC